MRKKMFQFPFDFKIIKPNYKGPCEIEKKGNNSSLNNVENKNLPIIFTPLKIRNYTLKNRIVVSPMCQYSSEDGFMNDWHLVHLGTFAKGGAALVFTEATSVTPEGRISYFDTGLWKDEQIEMMKKIVDFIHLHDSLAGIQLAHAGRKASTTPPFFERESKRWELNEGGWIPIGPSPIAWNEKDFFIPKEMTKNDIKEIINAFIEAAKRAEKAGFDIIEIHGAHGYLIHSFLSPISNKRMDEYGGSFEGRIKLCLEIVKAIREVWSNKPLFIRLSCSDWIEGGWDIDQTIKLSKILKELGIDIIDCSSGGVSPLQKIIEGPGYQVPFSEKIKKEIEGIKTAAVGKITDPQQAETILSNQQADLIVMAREFLREPFWPLKAANYFNIPVQYCPQYERAKKI
jgi:2,4-dienoyl-CoA reductase-like NADH-dependent reductase (Old Yellow Enzyme family)